MKRILVIDTVEFQINGISNVIINYFENIDHCKFYMDFVVNKSIEAKYEQKIKNGGATVYILNRNHNPMKYFFDMIKIVKSGRYDVVHVHGNSCTMAIELLSSKIAGCKKRIAHSHNSSCSHKILHKVLRPIFEICCTDRLACSNLAGDWLFHKKNFTVIENAMNLDKYRFDIEKRRFIRQELGIAEENILLGHVGGFSEAKNQQYLVDILKVLCQSSRKYRLIFVGEGKLKQEIQLYAEKNHLEDKVIFYGVTEDMVGILSAMDIFVFPSKWEGLPLALLEAQFLNLPVVVSENVTREVKISDRMAYLRLDQSVDNWCEMIEYYNALNLPREEDCVSKEEKMRFDIKLQIKVLENFYK